MFLRLTRMIRRRGDDAGAALMTTILVGTVLVGLGTTVTTIAVANLQNASRDRAATGALGAAEAGIAQAVEYMRSYGVGILSCAPNCTDNPWGSKASPAILTFPDGRTATVYVSTVQAFAPPTYKIGTYKIHSVGTADAGPGKRTLEQTITVKPFEYPMGIFAESFDDAGNGSVHTSHMFSRGCIANRNAIRFNNTGTDPATGTSYTNDPYYGYPAAAHSATFIITDNQSSRCSSGYSIHTPNDCNNTYRSDQDSAGGPVGDPCGSLTMDSNSHWDLAKLEAVGWLPRGLTQAQYDQLKAKARSQGNYWDATTLGSFVAPCPVAPCSGGRSPYPNAVVYFKLTSGAKLTGQIESIAGYERSFCGKRSLVVVVEGGDVSLNSNMSATIALFIPDGTLRVNARVEFEGTLFAKRVEKFNGTADFHLSPCFLANLPGGILEVTPTRFREVDR